MKRILVTILSILYMASAMGATVHIHYCMGRFMNASLSQTEDALCSKCGMKKAEQKKGCCKDEHKTFKTADHQLAKVSFDFSHEQFTITSLSYFNSTERACNSTVNIVTKAHAPPSLWRTCPIYIQVRDFRI